ncbi:MAG: putative bifunctional diguanylate cyclase/phosphodiesterase [Hyphomicrobiaceae bacterium]
MWHFRNVDLWSVLAPGPIRPEAPAEAASALVDPSLSARRLEAIIRDQDIRGEQAIALAQGAIAIFVLLLHVTAQIGGGGGLLGGNLWVVAILSVLFASSMARLWIARSSSLPERTLDAMNVFDVGVFLGLLWSYQYAYEHAAGGVLKAPSLALLFVLVAARALRFHPRPVVVTGIAAIAGWGLIVLLAINSDGGGMTRSYATYLGSVAIMIGAEVERMVALAGLVAVLAIATHKAGRVLSQAAHASDYADALEAARRNLKDATEARSKAEHAMVELDRRDVERAKLTAQLADQKNQLDVALDNMSQGLSLFDAEQRIVFANRRYAEMYDLPLELLEPGTTLRQILTARAAKGFCESVDAQRWVEFRLASFYKDAAYVVEMSDGRFIFVRRRQVAGGGVVSTHEDVSEQRRSEAKIAHMAHHDALTGLPNRVQLGEQLEQALTFVKRGGSIAAHLLDLDHFKAVNDTLGHAAGDKLLQLVAGRLRPLVQEQDTIARMGGDEFAILQVGLAHPAEASALALRVIEAVSAPYEIDGQPVTIGASVGIAVGTGDGFSPDMLMRNADLALYQAKGDGRGAFRFFEPEMDAQMQERRAMERDLRGALAAGQFELHYQPVFELKGRAISGFEALIRWRHPERGLVSPASFIPLAEETGLIVAIGEWVIREACATVAGWPAHMKVAVNVSPAQFRSPGLLSVIVSALATSGLRPDRLEIEITETVLLHNDASTLGVLEQIHALGVRIAMDDFGTGYSSLSYLQSFPFDKIKIDRSFIKDIVGNKSSSNIVRAVAALAKGLGATATAEGVETEAQLDAVLSEGCNEIQGFLMGRPCPAHEIEERFLGRPSRPEASRTAAA